MSIPYVPLLKPHLGSQVVKGHSLGPVGGLVGCWLMNEGSGNKVFDLSGNGGVGTEQTDSVWVTDKFGPVRLFSGDDIISVAGLSSLTGTARTLIVWAAADDWSDTVNNAIFNFLTWGINCYTYNTGGVDYIAWRINSDDRHLMSMAGISDGTFHQLACVVDSNDIITDIYLDGVAQTHGASTGYGILVGDYIGGRGNDDRFKGKISHLYAYSRGLSTSEMALLYREPFCMFKDPAEVVILGGQAAVGYAGIMTLNTGYWGI